MFDAMSRWSRYAGFFDERNLGKIHSYSGMGVGNDLTSSPPPSRSLDRLFSTRKTAKEANRVAKQCL